ncbi:MAG: hypothetical protein WC269_06225 [Candidatus Gracilibacteria bacterium]|jgi:hypothetical protein
MSPDNLKFRLKNLNIKKKIILVGSLLATVSVVMPWYKDLDRFKTGDVFLGVSGPTYLAGIIVMLLSILCLGLVLLELFEKPKPKLPINENAIYVMAAGLSIFMMIIVNSVYFHPKFGINLVEKTMGFGMYIAFFGLALELVGGIMVLRKTEINFDTAGKIEPLIDMNKEREQQDITDNQSMGSQLPNSQFPGAQQKDPLESFIEKQDQYK